MTICNKCNNEKDDLDFPMRIETGKRRTICRTCHAEQSAKSRVKRDLNRNQYEYGLTKQEFEELLGSQGGICPICTVELTTANRAIDHNHTTGVVRGILCITCNLALGGFKDSYSNLRNAMAYLEGSDNKKQPLLHQLLTIGTGGRINVRRK